MFNCVQCLEKMRKLNSKMRILYAVKVFFWLAVITAGAARSEATLIVTGSDINLTLPGNPVNAIVDGYDATNMATPSMFSVNFLVHGNGTYSSADFMLSQVPYTVVGGLRYFAIVYDAQETSGGRPVQIDNVTLYVNGVGVVWTSTDAMLLNSTTPYTDSPLGNGPDMALLIPVSVLDGLGLVGSNTARLTVTQSQSDNGPDEWEWTDKGIIGGVSFFGPNEPISSVVVPEPSTAGLILIGCALLLAVRKGRKSKPTVVR